MNKFTARLLTSVAALAGLLYSATSGATNLAELPLKASVLAKPNVIFAMDDSGSMDWEVMLATDGGTVWWDKPGATAWDASGNPIASDSGNNREMLAYLFPGTYDNVNLYDTFDQGWYGVPPTPQFAALRSSDFHKAYFNPDPANTYDDWPPGHDGTTQSDYAPVSVANALAGSPSVLAPVKPLSNNTVDLLKDRRAQVRMFAGMVVPAGAWTWNGNNWVQQNANLTLTATTWALIPYYPATYWKKVASADCSGTDVCVGVPNGDAAQRLKRYQIRRSAYTSDAAFLKDIQRFANWFTYYRKRVTLTAGSMGKVLEGLNGMRVGVVAFNKQAPVTMYDLDSSDNARNGVRVAGIFYANPASGGTPTQSTLAYIHEQFKRDDKDSSTGKYNVIQYACQRNAAFIVTDGFYNSGTVSPPSYDRSIWGGGAPFATTHASTLADQALAYYTINPRPDFTAGRLPTSNTASVNPDLNPNLHINTYALTLNMPGVLWDGVATYPTGTVDWPTPTPDTRSAIDDIWHATINGRGKMYNVTDPREAVIKIDEGLRDILSQVSAQGGVAVSSVNLDAAEASDAKAYLGKYNPSGWTGDLEARPINRTTGQISSTTSSWTDADGKPATAASLLGQRDWTTRRMFTSNGSSGGVAFTAGNVGAAVNPDSAKYTNAQVVNYLRGSRAGEGWSGESVVFRRRDYKVGLMGPVINAEPALSITDKVVYVASGEGFLHAFDTDNGQELWAYTPYDNLSKLGSTVLRGYAFQTKLDSTPALGKYSESGKLLVGGMGAGGRSYYALDVTNPRPASEAAAAGMVKWTFPAASDSTNRNLMGYTVGKPLLVRTAANGYVVLVTSGYDNGLTVGDGKGRLWMLDAATGAVIKSFATTVGSTSSEAGLAHIAAALESDGTVRYAFGGDLRGNLWRFDLTAAGTTDIAPALLASFKDGSSNAQPVTTAPALVKLDNRLIVLIGTGRILDITDFGSSVTQTFYAVSNGTTISNARASLEKREYTRKSDKNSTVTGDAFTWDNKRGWYMDLPAGEHSNTRPAVAYDAVVFVTNQVGASDCSASSTLYQLDIGTGLAMPTAPSYVSVQLSATTNSSAALVVKLKGGKLKVIGQFYDPSKGKGTWEEDTQNTSNIQAGKNAWRQVITQ